MVLFFRMNFIDNLQAPGGKAVPGKLTGA